MACLIPHSVAAVALLAMASGVAVADDDEPPTGAVLVDLVADADSAPWIAEALELNIERELAGYQRLGAVDEATVDVASCADDAGCRLAAYAAAGADIVMVGRVGANAIDYRLYETWTPALVSRGTLDVGAGETLISLKQQTLRALQPFLTQGGLLDQKPFLTAARDAEAAPAADQDRALRASGVALASIAGMFAVPVVLGLLLVRRRRLRLLRYPAVITAVVLAGAAAGFAGPAWTGDVDVAAALRRGEWTWLVGIAGGVAWGLFLVDAFRYAFPPLHGLASVGHRDVFRLLASWFYACLQRVAILVAYYAPFALAALWMCDAMSVPTRTAIVFVTPIAGLVGRLWLATWVECLTPFLDDRLVTGEASRDNPWHAEVRHYFMGYVRREGWNIDYRRLKRILFVPARVDGVTSWGGGGIASRVAIDERLLALAMGGVETTQQDEEPVEWPTWSDGILAGHQGKASPPRPRRPGPRAGSLSLHRLHTLSDMGHRKQLLGQAATLLGYVAPTAPDELVPLIADDIADLEVVRSLLAEHYPWMEADPDEEHDDTDPTDRDFLFGALAREIGVIERRDQQRATLGLSCLEAAKRAPMPIRRVVFAARWLVATFTTRFPAMVADTYAALHFARHHLIQYLFLRQTNETGRLTARATPEDLERLSAAMLNDAGTWEASRRDRFVLHGSLRNRLVWLSRLFPEPIADRREARLRWIVTALIALALAAQLGFAVKRAMDYHPVYVDRIAEQERKLLEAKKKAEERKPKRPPPHDQRLRQAEP